MRQLSIFDSHFHIIDSRFPLTPNQGYLPEPFTIDEYLQHAARLGVVGGAVVSGSFQGFDQTYLLDALARLGSGFVGVTQIPASTPEEDIRSLHAAGVRGVRVNLYRGGSETLDWLEDLAHRVFELVGWHTELYLDARDLPDLEGRLAVLPQIVIDHLGLSRQGFDTLLRLVDRGARVKASGFGRVDLDVPHALRAIAAVNPAALLFGTDLPSIRASRPFADSDVNLVVDTLGEALAARVLHDNAIDFYKPTGEQGGPGNPIQGSQET